MGVISYIAKRSIIGGHTAGIEYKIETSFQDVDAFDKVAGTQINMLNADTEYELDNIRDFYHLTSDLVDDADLDEWKEFFNSVAGRESFNVDLTGTIAAPGTDLASILERGGYQPLRDGNLTYRFTFDIRLL